MAKMGAVKLRFPAFEALIMTHSGRRWLSTLALAIGLTQCGRLEAEGPVPDEEIERFARASNDERPQLVWSVRENLKDLRRRRNPDLLRASEEFLSKLEDPFAPYYARHGFEQLTLGSVSSQFRVEQVVSGTEAIVGYFNETAEIKRLVLSTMTQAPAAASLREKAQAEIDANTVPYYLDNYPTKGMVDGEEADISGVFYLDTRTYATAIGSQKTIPSLRFVDLGEYDDLFNRERERRTWTLLDGTTLNAIYVRYEKGQLVLALDKKTIKSIALSKLSKEDRELVRDLIKPPAQVDEGRGGRGGSR